MDAISKAFITLIRSALTAEQLALPEDFCLEEVCRLAGKHHIENMIYEGAVNCGVDKKLPAMQTMFSKTCHYLMRSTRQMKAIEKLYDAFDAAGVDYMPLKGCNLKKLYPRPELRIMGDADILIRLPQYDVIKAIVQQLGYRPFKESNHEIVWDSSDLHLELHKCIVADHHAVASAYYGDGWEFAKLQKGTRYAMTPEDELVYLFSHFTVHYREGGIGCRQLLDIWVYQNAYPQMNQTYLRAQLEKLQLLKFYDNVCHTLDVWFGDKKQDAMSDFISQVILSNGSWGTMEKQVVAKIAKNTKPKQLKERQRKTILWSVFPSLKRMQQIYPVLHKAPVLMPMMWVARWCSLLLKQRKRVTRWFSTHTSVSEAAVSEFQEGLDYVGLSYKH